MLSRVVLYVGFAAALGSFGYFYFVVRNETKVTVVPPAAAVAPAPQVVIIEHKEDEELRKQRIAAEMELFGGYHKDQPPLKF